MWGLTGLLLILQGLAIVLLYLPDVGGRVDSSLLPQTRGILASSLFGLTILFCLYIFDKQIELRRLRSALTAERLQMETVQSRLSELSALFEVAAHMNSHLAPRAYLEAVMDRLLVALKAEGACIMKIDEETEKLHCEAVVGMDFGLAPGSRVGPGDGISGWVAQHMEPLVMEREELETRFPGLLPQGSEILSVLCVPLAVSGELVGTLLLWRTIGNWLFSHKDASLLMLFGEHVAKDIRRMAEVEALNQKALHLEGANRKLSELHDVKRVFLSTVKREIRAPLAGVSYNAELLARDDGGLDPDLRKTHLHALSDHVVNLAEFINEITELLALEAGEETLNLSTVQLNEVVSDSVLSCTPIAAQKGVVILTELEPDLPELSLDESKFSQAIQYLASHAVRSAERNSTIRIVTRFDGTVPAESTVSVEIIDEDGTGEDGESRDAQGLGLYLVGQLVGLHGGTIWTDAPARVGFRLPTAKYLESATVEAA
jgi:signal transduction histidine kinase